MMMKRKTKAPEDRWMAATFSTAPIVLECHNHSSAEDVKLASSSLQKGQPSARLVSRLRRSGAKLLSRLRIWSSGKTSSSGVTSSSLVDMSAPWSTNVSDLDSDRLSISNNLIYPTDFLDDTPDQPNSEHGGYTASPTDISVLPTNDSQSKLNPIKRAIVLPRRLSQKIHIFRPPTVIRRTVAKPRARVANFNGSCPVSSHEKWDDSTPESIEPPPAVLPILSQTDCRSSLDAVSPSFRALPYFCEDYVQRLASHPSRSAPSIQPPTSTSTTLETKPSIVTVESTAAAKVFFETHFDSIFSAQDSRNQRLRELIEHFRLLPFTSEEQIIAHQAWITQESDYLRQSRVLKTRSNRCRNTDAISAAGYEMIRVLGRGSFGVVQLVKERDMSQDSSNQGRSDCSSTLEGVKCSRNRQRSTTKSAQISDDRISRNTLQGHGNVYAMKIIRKDDMVRLCQEGHIRAEREFLTLSERSKWIVPLIASFQDTDHLYLVMEYEVGGDFFGLLIRQGVLSERDAMWYVAEMILCVEEAHRLGWIHRDVKPENFLISASGHLKLADFGLAFDGHWSHNQAYFTNHRYSLISKLGIEVQGDSKDQSESHESRQSVSGLFHTGMKDAEFSLGECMLDWRNRNEKRRFARSIVGTSQYMAPEIINGESYDGRCDYWSIGIILYECLYGGTPFYRENREETKNFIRHHKWTLNFPQDRPSDMIISYHAIDLIQQLLQKKEFRLSSRGYKTNDSALWHGARIPGFANSADPRNFYYRGKPVYPDDASDIKTHRFFRHIPWNEMLHHRPPYVPEAKIWQDANTSFHDADELDSLGGVIPQGKCPLINDSMPAPSPEPDPDVLALLDYQKIEAAKEDNTSQVKLDTIRKLKKREKKRARDKILRDAVVGPTALDVRTKAAFVGYTWRRPKSVRNVLEIERGRSLMSDNF